MFQQLTDFSYQRTVVQSIGFYLFYTVVGLVLVFISALLVDLVMLYLTATDQSQFGQAVGQVVAEIFEITLIVRVMHRKEQMSKPGYLALILLGAALTYFGDVISGTLVVAHISRRVPRASLTVLVQGQQAHKV